MRLFGRQIVGNALVHRRETEQVPALYLTRFACGGLGKPSRVLAADAGASDGDGLSHCRIILPIGNFKRYGWPWLLTRLFRTDQAASTLTVGFADTRACCWYCLLVTRGTLLAITCTMALRSFAEKLRTASFCSTPFQK